MEMVHDNELGPPTPNVVDDRLPIVITLIPADSWIDLDGRGCPERSIGDHAVQAIGHAWVGVLRTTSDDEKDVWSFCAAPAYRLHESVTASPRPTVRCMGRRHSHGQVTGGQTRLISGISLNASARGLTNYPVQ
jgi:hypothetical protein